jgi:hypothetical protein
MDEDSDYSCTNGEMLCARIHKRPPEVTVGRYATFTCGFGVQYVEGPHFDEVRLCSGSSPVVFNSLVLIPMLLTLPECEGLVAEVERLYAMKHDVMTQSEGCEVRGMSLGFARYTIPAMNAAKTSNLDAHAACGTRTSALFEDVLRVRLLPFITRHLPCVAAMVVERSFLAGPAPVECELHMQPLRFSAAEPAVNRYTAGGRFTVHSDKLALTLNCLLSSAFSGGGTEFWCEATDAEVPVLDAGQSVHIQPHVGVGVVFNGRVLHSGSSVRTGVRHLLVASFSIADGGR